MKQADIEQARLNNAAGVLQAEVCRLANGMEMTEASLRRIAEWVKIHRADCKRMGIDFPEMIVLGFPRIRAVEIVRKDWERHDVEVWILTLPKKYPDIRANEIADAVRIGWPDYKAAVLNALPRMH